MPKRKSKNPHFKEKILGEKKIKRKKSVNTCRGSHSLKYEIIKINFKWYSIFKKKGRYNTYKEK